MSSTNNASDVLSEIIQIIAEIGKVPGLTPDQDFYAAGVTSITALPLLLEMEDRFHISIPDDRFIEARTPRALEQIIANLKGE